jgi:hypothetical protein
MRISSGAALCALLAVPVACSSDTNNGSNDGGPGPDTGAGASNSTGGKSSSGGSSGSAGKTSTGGSTTSTGGSGGSTSSGGKTSTGGTGAGGKTTSPEAGPDSSAGGGNGMPDSGAGGMSTDSGPKPPACPPPTDSTKASLCLTWDVESVIPIPQDPRLDNKGQLIVVVTDPADPTHPKTIMIPPPEADGGLGGEIDISGLPPLLPLGATPIGDVPTTVFVNAYFIDNPEWYLPPISKADFTYGMYVGGYDLAAGVYPKPTPKAITGLTAGAGNIHQMSLTALRRFTTTVKWSQATSQPLQGDGQGPLRIGAYDVSAAKGANPRGGALLGCKDITKGDIPATGFFYRGTRGPDAIWLIADLSDFNFSDPAQPGDVLSLGGGQDGQSAPNSAMIDLAGPDGGNWGNMYSYTIPALNLNAVLPFPGMKPADYHCP